MEVDRRIRITGKARISELVRDKISEPFFKTKPTGSGTGLGHSLSYSVAAQSQGDIRHVEGTEGESTSFIICRPLERMLAGATVW